VRQIAVVKPKTWYQSHCNECGSDVGFFPKPEMAQEEADRHNSWFHPSRSPVHDH
jgi:hypothetical protein